MSSAAQPNDKFKTLDKLLGDEFALIHLDPKRGQVVLPAHLLAQTSVTLKISRLFKGGIELRTDCIETSLLFNQQYFDCVIPYQSIWGATAESGQTFIWPNEFEPERIQELITAATQQAPATTQPAKTAKPGKPRKTHLQRVK